MYALTLLAVQAPEDRSGLESILPPAAELFWGAVAFVIVYYIVARFAFPRIDDLLEQRQASIQGRLEEAEAKFAEAEQVRAQYEAQVRDARNEANRIVEQAKGTAESLRRDIVARAEAEAQAVVQRAQAEVATERERALQQLRAEVGSLSVELAGRIMEKELDPASHQELVDHYIQSLAGSN